MHVSPATWAGVAAAVSGPLTEQCSLRGTAIVRVHDCWVNRYLNWYTSSVPHRLYGVCSICVESDRTAVMTFVLMPHAWLVGPFRLFLEKHAKREEKSMM